MSIDTFPVKTAAAQRPKQLPAWMAVSFEDRMQQEEEQLQKWLEEIKLQDLRAMARERGWRVKGTRKADVARQVAAQIVVPEGIQQAIAGLDAEHRAVLRAMVLLDGDVAIPLEELARVAEIWTPLKSYKQFNTYTRHLRQLGLALPGEVWNSYPPRLDFCPVALVRHFPPLLRGEVPTPRSLPASTPASGLRLAEPLAMVRAAGQIAVLLEQMPVPLRPPMPRPRLERIYSELKDWDYDPDELARFEKDHQGRSRADLVLTVPPPGRALPDEAIERLAPLAGGEVQLDFVYALLVAAGLFYPGSPTTVWPDVKIEYLRRGEEAQRSLLGRTYLHLSEWNELWEVVRRDERLALKREWRYGYVKPEHLKAGLLQARHLVLRSLASLPDERWVSLADFLALMQSLWPSFAPTFRPGYRHMGRVGSWFLSRDGQPLGVNDAADWDLAQGNFIREIIGGPLHWLGFADLKFEGENFFAFRLHGVADLVWDRADVLPLPRHAADLAPATPAAEAVTIDDLSIRVNPAAVSAQAHSLLDEIARLEVVDADNFVYHLNAQAAYESFERGVSLPDLLAEWEPLLRVPVSEPIRAQLDAWWDAYGRVRIYENLTVVEFGDEFALAELKGVTSLAKYVVAEISPRLIIVRPEGVESLVAELEQAGYTPKQTEEIG